MTHDRYPSRSRNATARTTAGQSLQKACTVARWRSPGLSATTRKIAARVSGATTGCDCGLPIDMPSRLPSRAADTRPYGRMLNLAGSPVKLRAAEIWVNGTCPSRIKEGENLIIKEALRVQPFGVLADHDFAGVGRLRRCRRARLEQRDHSPGQADFWRRWRDRFPVPLRHPDYCHRRHRDGESCPAGGAYIPTETVVERSSRFRFLLDTGGAAGLCPNGCPGGPSKGSSSARCFGQPLTRACRRTPP